MEKSMIKVRVPQTIQVGLHQYRICFHDWELVDDGSYSRVNHRLQIIEMNSVRPLSQRVASLIHEILHIVDHVYLDGTLSEKDINGIAQGLAQALGNFNIELDWSNVPIVKLDWE